MVLLGFEIVQIQFSRLILRVLVVVLQVGATFPLMHAQCCFQVWFLTVEEEFSMVEEEFSMVEEEFLTVEEEEFSTDLSYRRFSMHSLDVAVVIALAVIALAVIALAVIALAVIDMIVVIAMD